MKLTARARLDTWANVSRVQSDEVMYDLERTVVGSVLAGVTADRCGQCGACDRPMVSVAMGNRETGDMEMTDIVDRLRNWVSYSNGIPSQPEICKEAADEIERLRAENEKLRTLPMKYRRMEFNAQLQKENEELRAELAQRGEPAVYPVREAP